MDVIKLQRLYKERNLNNFMLRTIEDLEYIHGVKLEQIDGYTRLSESEKKVFKSFILVFFNSHSIIYRELVPLKVFIAIEKSYVIDTETIRNLAIRKVIINDRLQEIDSIWQNDRFKEEKGRLYTIERYMRFEYIDNGRNTWTHINKLGGWY